MYGIKDEKISLRNRILAKDHHARSSKIRVLCSICGVIDLDYDVSSRVHGNEIQLGGLVLRLIQNVSCHVCVDAIVEVPVIKAVGSFVSLGLVLCNKYTTHKVDPEEFSTKL